MPEESPGVLCTGRLMGPAQPVVLVGGVEGEQPGPRAVGEAGVRDFSGDCLYPQFWTEHGMAQRQRPNTLQWPHPGTQGGTPATAHSEV